MTAAAPTNLGSRTPTGALNVAATPTTTTLVVTPSNPVAYPTQVHVKATVAPPPTGDGGFLPAVGFYVDGVFRAPAPLDGMGVGEADLSLGPGTYSVTAQFGGNSLYGPSTSSAVGVVVVQRPDLATEQGASALQSSLGFSPESHSSLVAATSPSIGVGPTDIITMNEGGVRFYDRAGTPLFHVSLPDFFFYEPQGQANDTPRGARILFDALHSRWIAAEVTHDASVGSGHVYIQVSDTADALGNWWTYRFDFANRAPRNPAIGVSSDKVAIGYDVSTIDTSADLGSTVLVVDTASLFANVSVLDQNSVALNPAIHTWRPAVGRSAGTTIHAVGWSSTASPGHLMSLTATGTVASGGIAFTTTDLTAGATALPDLGDAGSIGPTSATWVNNHLWFVSTRTCLPEGDVFSESCVRITELGTGGAVSPQQDFVINRSGYSTFGGGLGIADDGSVVIAYSQASSAPCPCPIPFSTYATVQDPADPAGSVRPSQLIADGQPTCAGGPDCFGINTLGLTALSMAADPTDSHSLWQASVVTVPGGWGVEATRLSRASAAPDGTFVLAGGRTVTNSLRLGIGLTPAGSSTATQVLLSNSPTTSAGVLSMATAGPIDGRVPWSLADPATGGSSSTGTRTVYLQWGDGRGGWSAVQQHSISVGTPIGADFVNLNPARLLDTRTGNGLSGPFISRVPRSFQVTGRGGVPASATAVTGNLTVTAQTTGGFLFIGPTATSTPTSSTLNFPLRDTRANGVTVKLGSGGKLGVVFVGGNSSAKAQVIFDVTGYFIPDDPASPQGGTYVPIDPVRALDTRAPIGLSGKFQTGVPRTFCVTGCVPVPDDAIAVTGNLTVTRQSTAGYIFLGPSASSHPTSSTLNFPIGDNRANNVTVGLDADGNLSAVFKGTTSTATTHIVFDITGYFVRGPWGATFIPLVPARILDSRIGIGLSGPFVNHVPRPFPVAGQGGVPAAGTVAVTGNVTLTRQTSTGFAFLGPTASATPSSSTINVPPGENRANGIDVGLAGDGTLGAVWVSGQAGSTTDMVFDVLGYFR